MAITFLSSNSSDESWIDASGPYIKKKLTELLSEIYSAGLRDARESDRAHSALGVWPGAFDE